MSSNLKFEFDFDDVFEGIKHGVIRELSKTNFSDAKNYVINQLKNEIKNEIRLTYGDTQELKDEIKNEIKSEVFEKILTEKRNEYNKLYSDFCGKELSKVYDDVEKEIKSKVIGKLYNDLYDSIQHEMNKNMKSVIAQLVNNIRGNNIKVENTDKIITNEEYERLLHRNEILNALEQGGVDNWEWYGESLQQYFGDDEE